MNSLPIFIASDHAGVKLKSLLVDKLAALKIVDLGPTESEGSVDYPDFAYKVVQKVLAVPGSRGILICSTGIGMSIMANRFSGIRAALVHNIETARLSREHNDANVLCLGAKMIPGSSEAFAIVQAWLHTQTSEEPRHRARVSKLLPGYAHDPELFSLLDEESVRQRDGLEMIASENFTSRFVQEAQGSTLTNKYAEGYPGKRYYGGCEVVDKVETLAIKRLSAIYSKGTPLFANVQPHSGSQANQSVYFSQLKPGDTIMGMSLAHGGHLTHGSPANLSGKIYRVVSYGTDPQTHRIDMQQVREIAMREKPKLIIAGASAYPRTIDFESFSKIAQEAGALFMVDMAHIAGLVATGHHPSPIGLADFVTSTTHKTLRGPRGGFVLTSREDHAKAINSIVFPGLQGGPLMHVIAAKAVAFGEALKPGFKNYIQQVVTNTQTLANSLMEMGLGLVSGGTDNHLLLADLSDFDDGSITGKQAEEWLGTGAITVNKNAVPGDKRGPFVTSGIRIGTAALTTRGMGPAEMKFIAKVIIEILKSKGERANALRPSVIECARSFT